MIQFRTDFTTTAARTSNPVRAMKDDQCLNNNNLNVTCYLSFIHNSSDFMHYLFLFKSGLRNLYILSFLVEWSSYNMVYYENEHWDLVSVHYNFIGSLYRSREVFRYNLISSWLNVAHHWVISHMRPKMKCENRIYIEK